MPYLIDKYNNSINCYCNNNLVLSLNKQKNELTTINGKVEDIRKAYKGLIVSCLGYKKNAEDASSIYIVPFYCAQDDKNAQPQLSYLMSQSDLNAEINVKVSSDTKFNFNQPSKASAQLSKAIIETCKACDLLNKKLHIAATGMLGAKLPEGGQEILPVYKIQEKLLIAILSKVDIFICNPKHRYEIEIALENIKYNNQTLHDIAKQNNFKIIYTNNTSDLTSQLSTIIKSY